MWLVTCHSTRAKKKKNVSHHNNKTKHITGLSVFHVLQCDISPLFLKKTQDICILVLSVPGLFKSFSVSGFESFPFQKSPQTESCTDSGAENEGSCHSDQMSNDFSTDDCVDEGICLDSTSSTERMMKPKVILFIDQHVYYDISLLVVCCLLDGNPCGSTHDQSSLILVKCRCSVISKMDCFKIQPTLFFLSCLI